MTRFCLLHVKGISLNYEASQLVNFDTIKETDLRETEEYDDGTEPIVFTKKLL